uniref:LTA synthase family protein n=1 Tax=Candidatus Enterococcus willemsii TaxID=1857215 RepID=UPI00403F9566
MKNLKMPNFLNTRLGFFGLLTVLLWAKNIAAYLTEFNLGIESPIQYFILFINPIATTLLLLSIALYVRRKKLSYTTMMIIYLIMTILLFANITYYREFTDFITINTMLGAGKVAEGLGQSALKLFHPTDVFYFLDFVLLTIALMTKTIKMEEKPVRARMALAVSTLAIMVFSGNLFLAETDRTGLLTRTFSRDYLVKYLGINAFTAYDAVQTYKTTQVRAEASPNDMKEVEDYVKGHYAAPNDDMFGIAKGKNVIYIHLESTQQFLIDYKLKDENGVEHEVMPFVNSLYHDKSTYSFDNFFHQVKAGKTSDAETLLETSLFGLNQGAFFTQFGGKNTFEAAPDILKQTQDYTTAVFHGNSGNFWNRNEVYKRFGYDYFFDASYYDVNEDNSFQYGLHDKPFFQQSAQYLERLQQPFYAKFIAVSNHYPYAEFTNDDAGFPMANTPDETINGYFATANYLDKSVEEFFNYLKESGLYENSVIVLYGDHYGVSNGRNRNLAELVGKSSSTWNDYDNAQMQRVPYMIHIPGQENGGINHTYGAQIDAVPTLLHLLGVDTSNYIQLGQDLFSKDHQQMAVFRDGSFMTPEYTYYGGTLYSNETKLPITEPSEELQAKIDELQKEATTQLEMSDKVNNGDLLRFHTNSGLEPIDPNDYSYKNIKERLINLENELGDKSTSVYSQHNNQSTVDMYQSKSYQEYNPTITEETTNSEE